MKSKSWAIWNVWIRATSGSVLDTTAAHWIRSYWNVRAVLSTRLNGHWAGRYAQFRPEPHIKLTKRKMWTWQTPILEVLFFGLRLDSREICMAGCCRIFIPVLNLSGWCCISFGFDIDSMVFTCGRKTFSSISYPGRSISRRFAVLATIIRYHFPFVLSKTTILYIGFVVIFHVAVVLLDVKSTSLIPERMKNRNHLFPAFHSALVSMFHRCATSVIDVNCTLSWILVTIMKSCNQQVEMACSGSLLFQYHFHFIEIIFHFCRA